MSLPRGHVLVVDDLATNRDALTRLLGREGLTTETAAEGMEALEKVRAGCFDAVLLDVMMPVLNGVDTLRILKREPELRDLPVIMLSAHNEGAAIRECIELGADDYLPKPIDRALLRARLSACLRRKQFMDKEKGYLARLEASNEELRRLSQLKSRFLATAAHDLKNPLSAVLLLAGQISDLAGQEEGASLQRKKAQRIRESVDRMLGIIQALLDSAAHEAGCLTLKRKRLDLQDLLRLVTEDNRDCATSKRITLDFEASEAPVEAEVDETRMREVLDNLVNNAIKFSPQGTRVRVHARREGHLARIEIQDQGPGLTDEDKQAAFSPYQRLSAKPTGNEMSTGLGLSIVKHLVDLHGGRVAVESLPGHGATFIVEVPLTASR